MSDLHYEVHPGSGPVLLLVHGFLSSRAQWRLNLEALGEFCRPVVVELWGHGRSPHPGDTAAFTPESYLEQFEKVRKAVGAESWLVCGQSLGASLTLRYSLEFPERVIAQIFTNSNSAMSTEEQTRQRWIDAKEAIEAIDRDGLVAVEALRVHPRHAKRLPEAVHRELLEDAAMIIPAAIADSYRHLNPVSSVRARAAEISVPTLLAFGHYEKRFHAAKDYAVESIPGLELVELEAGHAVNIQDADGFNQHARTFFERYLV